MRDSIRTLGTTILAGTFLAVAAVPTATALAERDTPAAASPASPASSSDTTLTASAITELTAEKVSTGSSARVRVSGRLVEGSTLTFPLARLPLTVQVADSASVTPARCHARTTDRGAFSCSVEVSPGASNTMRADFAGNELFAPCSATTSIGTAGTTPLLTEPARPDTTATTPSTTATPTPAASTPALSTPATVPTSPALPTAPELPTAPAATPLS
ncbi:hypothetical protein [Streptomyces sp. NPDC052114]|uniref:hypothetical protein n=1 Tax=unclassified Streptomyces TaxID=2593676 RepID=UPI00341F8ED6